MRCDIPGIKDGPPDSLFCLAPEWVYLASIVTFGAVSSYLPFSPLPQASPRRLFSVTLSVTLGCPCAPPLSQGFLPYGVRTFLSPPKRQANAHTPRSTGANCPAVSQSASGKLHAMKHHIWHKKARSTQPRPGLTKLYYVNSGRDLPKYL